MEEAELSAAVALTKGVDDVQFSQKVGGEGDELFVGGAPFIRPYIQTIEQSKQLLIDVRRQAEEITSLGGLHDSRLSRPVVYILEKMPVNRAVVRNVELAFGKRLSCPQGRYFKLEGLKGRSVFQI